MSHNLIHTIMRGGTYVYNRRVPRQIANATSQKQIRISLGQDFHLAKTMSEALTVRLDEIWNAPVCDPINVKWLLETLKPKHVTLTYCAEAYLGERNIHRRPTELAVKTLIELAGDRDIRSYTRSEARQFARVFQDKGCKSATVRRRIQSVQAVLEFGLLELDSGQRNPFSKLRITNEGLDATKRGVFTEEQLRCLYTEVDNSNRDTFLAFPILGETGARLAEVVGLRWQDVDLVEGRLDIVPHSLRRLKTKSSERSVPLVDRALIALERLKEGQKNNSEFVFPRWLRTDEFAATHASNTLNGILKRRFPNLTCHCFRHTFRDRLRAVNAPVELADALGGWRHSRSVGSNYGHGYSLEFKRHWMEKLAL